jgi:uncharacterized LabA/DUF88 family protein
VLKATLGKIMEINISQKVAILVDGNNIERSIHSLYKSDQVMINFDSLVPSLLKERSLSRFIYFREGLRISSKLADRIQDRFHGSVQPCHKSADIPLTIKATQLASKVDTIIICSGDSDYVELVSHLKGEGVRVEICAVEQTLADVLKNEADYYYPISKDDCYNFPKKRTTSSKKTTKKTTKKVTKKN